MAKPTTAHTAEVKKATRTDLREILGDLDDETALAILALHPSVAQVEEARIWLDGEDEILGKIHRPLDGVVAQIYDHLKIEEEEPPPVSR